MEEIYCIVKCDGGGDAGFMHLDLKTIQNASGQPDRVIERINMCGIQIDSTISWEVVEIPSEHILAGAGKFLVGS